MYKAMIATQTALFVLTFFLIGSLAAEERVPTFTQLSRDEHASHVTTTEVRDALDLIPADITSISFGTSAHVGFDVFNTAATLFPTLGSTYFVMSSGDTASALTANTSASTSTELAGLNTAEGEDLVQTILVLNPPPGASCLAFDFAFYSEEFPEFVGSEFNDVFLSEIGQSNFQQVGNQIIAPNNFAFDTMGNVISVNTVFGVTSGAADTTTYDGGTPLLTAKTPLENPGDPITITLSIMDLGDSIYDSTVFIDNFRWLFGISCEPGADADTDRDSLLDSWETNGIDFDNDGTVDLDLPAMGADPMHKDIFVEIDYMVLEGVSGHTHKPKLDALDIVIEAFDNAPVSNPDGDDGIRIHIDAGSDTIMNPVTGATWGSMSKADVLTHVNGLGTFSPYNWSAFDTIKGVGTPGSFSIERGDVFHYSIFAHGIGALATQRSSGIARGIPSSDFIVSLGRWSSNPGTVNQQAGTLMHELGHNLGLLHGGDDGAGNYEPNYLSIMSYSFQTRGLRVGGADGFFDYSRFALLVLNENALNETAGLAGVAEAAGYGTRYYNGTSNTLRVLNDINGTIDWNEDSIFDNPVAVDINGTYAIDSAGRRVGGVGYCSIATTTACYINTHCGATGGTCQLLTVLNNTDNWDEIVFNGGAVGALGETTDLPMETEDNEISQEEDELIPTELSVGISGPGTVYLGAGSFTTYHYTVTNTGDDEETFDITTSAIQTWANTSSVPAQLMLLPDESSSFDVIVTIPGATPSGITDTLIVRAASSTNPLMMDAAETTTIVSIATIDIKPGSVQNPVNLKSKGLIPVAILGSSTFDVSDVDVTTLAFGPGDAKPAHSKGGHIEDVNSDDYMDLVSHFVVSKTGIASGNTEACLSGKTVGGIAFGDCDPVKVK